MDQPFWRTISPSPKKPVYYSAKTGKRISKCFGEKNGRSLLTREQVNQIREEFAHSTTTVTELSKKYGVSPRQIGRILSYVDWRY